jgi:hypothetical protein
MQPVKTSRGADVPELRHIRVSGEEIPVGAILDIRIERKPAPLNRSPSEDDAERRAKHAGRENYLLENPSFARRRPPAGESPELPAGLIDVVSVRVDGVVIRPPLEMVHRRTQVTGQVLVVGIEEGHEFPSDPAQRRISRRSLAPIGLIDYFNTRIVIGLRNIRCLVR